MECVAYVRVSTEKQAEEGNGIDSQKRDIELYARKNELIISDWYIDDGYTGANMNRPELQRLINDCMTNKIKGVVAFKLDRISRSMVDGIYIIERVFQPNDVKFYCVHDSVSYDSPMEQAYTQMMAVFAQLDKNTMMLRMRGGMLERIKKGYWRGGGNLPYCYSYDREKGILIPIPERAEQANRALDMYLDGYSDKKIGKVLGYKSEGVVTRILTSCVNIGMIPYKGNVYKGLHKPIFDIEKFNQGLAMRKRRKNNKIVSNSHMLTGICYCGECGNKMRYQKWGNGTTHLWCNSHDRALDYLPNYNPHCQNKSVDSAIVERLVEEKIKKISLDISKDDISHKEKKSEIMKKQLAREKEKLKRLYSLYSDGNDMVIDMIQEQERKIKSLQETIKEELVEEENTPSKDFVFDEIKNVADVWETIDNKTKNKILKSIISKIVIVNNNIDIIIESC